jgi:hypothetical protein
MTKFVGEITLSFGLTLGVLTIIYLVITHVAH